MAGNEKEKRDINMECDHNTYGILDRLLEPYCESFEILVNGNKC
jgi:hypothetical protein